MEIQKKKRVVYIVGTMNLGGIERLVTDLSILLKSNHEWEPVVCCTIKKEGPFVKVLENQQIPVFECPLNRNNPFDFIRRLSELLRTLSPDLFHSHVAYSMPWQIFGARLAGVWPIIFTHHSDLPKWKSNRLSQARIRFYFRACWPFISAYTAVSKNVQSALSELVGIPPAKFQVIYNPINTELFRPDPEARKIARNTMGFSDDDYVIGNVGRLALPKGHSVLLQSARQVISVEPRTRFVFVGNGPLEDVLKRQAKELQIQNNIVFYGRQTQVQCLYPAFDLYVCSSIREGFPISILEAMACELPIVSTNIGGVGEAIGIDYPHLVEPNDSNSLAREIINIMSDKEAQKLGKNSRLRAIKFFNVEKILKNYLDLYQCFVP